MIASRSRPVTVARLLAVALVTLAPIGAARAQPRPGSFQAPPPVAEPESQATEGGPPLPRPEPPAASDAALPAAPPAPTEWPHAARPAATERARPAAPGAPDDGHPALRHGAAPATEPVASGEATASTDGAGLRLTLDLGSLWRRDRGFGALSQSDASAELGLGAHWDAWAARPGLVLAAAAGWRRTAERAALGPAVQSDLRTDTFAAGASVRWEALPVLAPEATAQLGVTRHAARFAPGSGGALEAVAWGPMATAGVGLILRTPPGAFRGPDQKSAPFAFVVLVQAGVVVAPTFTLALHVVAPPKDALPGRAVTAGALDPSGAYLRWSLGVRF